MSCIRYISLAINCAYARVNIYDNSRDTKFGCLARKTIDKQKRALNFRSQFSMVTTYGIPESYFDKDKNGFPSRFDKDCDKILNAFISKWRGVTRDAYLANGLNCQLTKRSAIH